MSARSICEIAAAIIDPWQRTSIGERIRIAEFAVAMGAAGARLMHEAGHPPRTLTSAESEICELITDGGW